MKPLNAMPSCMPSHTKKGPGRKHIQGPGKKLADPMRANFRRLTHVLSSYIQQQNLSALAQKRVRA